jgi:hypothetical protein
MTNKVALQSMESFILSQLVLWSKGDQYNLYLNQDFLIKRGHNFKDYQVGLLLFCSKLQIPIPQMKSIKIKVRLKSIISTMDLCQS